ncbi:MAG: TetR/AcrR family transcriptional regulator [Methanomassiliicoccales archaeon]|nr:TetR/AcrR family transcriptional regulator [Methanomassiliicoccales archaeon]
MSGTLPSVKTGTAKERILSSAFELFAEKGYGTTTTKDIAQRAGVNEVTVFRSFGSKEALFKEVIKDRMPLNDIMAVVDFENDLPLEELLVMNAHRVLDVLKQNRHLFMMLVGEVWRHADTRERMGGGVLGNAIGFLAEHLESLVQRGAMRAVDPRTAARAWIGMVQSYYLFNYLLGPGNVPEDEEDRILRGLADVFVNGVGIRGGTDG